MDRNCDLEPIRNPEAVVALRKESVDRNFHAVQVVIVIVESLSARRAWIEIWLFVWIAKRVLSLSARRAWIEIFQTNNRFKSN